MIFALLKCRNLCPVSLFSRKHCQIPLEESHGLGKETHTIWAGGLAPFFSHGAVFCSGAGWRQALPAPSRTGTWTTSGPGLIAPRVGSSQSRRASAAGVEGIVTAGKEWKPLAALVGLWGIPSGLFSMSPLPISPVSQGVGPVPQPLSGVGSVLSTRVVPPPSMIGGVFWWLYPPLAKSHL